MTSGSTIVSSMPAAPSENAIGPPRPPAPTTVARVTPRPLRTLARAVIADHANARAIGAELALGPLRDRRRAIGGGDRVFVLVFVLFVVVFVLFVVLAGFIDETALALVAPVRRGAPTHLAGAVAADHADARAIGTQLAGDPTRSCGTPRARRTDHGNVERHRRPRGAGSSSTAAAARAARGARGRRASCHFEPASANNQRLPSRRT